MKLAKTVTLTYEVCPINGSYYCINENNVIVKLGEDELEEFDIVDESDDLIHDKLYFEIVDDSKVIEDGLVPIFVSDNIIQIIKRNEETDEIQGSILLLITEKEMVVIYMGEVTAFEKAIESIKKFRDGRKILYTNYVSAE